MEHTTPMTNFKGIGLQSRYFNLASLSDVTIHFDDSDQVKAHKVILATHSEHFRKMFESGFAESSSRDVNLQDDDPDALHGLLAWCYGLLCNGERTVQKEDIDPDHMPVYTSDSGAQDVACLRYLANLYVAADKYMVPHLKEHAKENWAQAMQRSVNRYQCVLREEEGADEFMSVLEEVSTLVYESLGDSAKELRPCLVKAVHEIIADLVDNEQFKKLMVEVPELSFDFLALAIRSKKSRTTQKSRKRARRSSSGSDSNKMWGLFD